MVSNLGFIIGRLEEKWKVDVYQLMIHIIILM